MALMLEDRPIRPLTADQVLRMVEAGILPDRGYELLHGVLTEVASQSPDHVEIGIRLHRWLAPYVAADRYVVRPANPLLVPDPTSLPEPDLAVVEAQGRDPKRHPSFALLAIEVSVSSLRIDTKIKPPLYAAAEVAEMWVIHVAKRRVHVLTEPGEDGYAKRRIATPPEKLAPVALDVDPLDISSLFEGLG